MFSTIHQPLAAFGAKTLFHPFGAAKRKYYRHNIQCFKFKLYICMGKEYVRMIVNDYEYEN